MNAQRYPIASPAMENRLAAESSPYLRQHAGNPVHWQPWDQRALDEARSRDLPILVSIGYSSCHWCHVMEHESFSDPQTAAYMNEHFVCIKVDREERPDVDAVYMEAVQTMAGHGGWPLTGFLTPGQVPFHMGTYFPPEPRQGMPSFMQVMEAVIDVWNTRRDEIEAQSGEVVDALGGSGRLAAGQTLVKDSLIERARHAYDREYDDGYGGFGAAPKFPQPPTLDFLLGVREQRTIEMAEITLRAMARGGIHDQLAGGFARYSVDERWEVPHFEKMLYDNAQLARVYLHGHQATRDGEFARVCSSTLDWMLDELTGDDGAAGGFCSALDADSDSPDGPCEGWFYTWPYDEFCEVCGEHADDMCAFFDVTERGDLDGRNVLRVTITARRPDDETFTQLRSALLERRAARPRPFRDDKRVTAWNALAVAALAEAGRVLREPRYIDAAVACAEFVERALRKPDGSLRRSWLDGTPGPDGFLEDHAHLVAAWLTLYESTHDERWFDLARRTADLMIERFGDDAGGFFSTASDAPALIARRKDIDDNPVPSGNSTAAHALLRLHAFTLDPTYLEHATGALKMLTPLIKRVPTGFPQALQAVQLLTGGVTEIAIIGEPDDFLTVIDDRYRPAMALAVDRESGGSVPLVAGRARVDGRPAAYVCEGFTCQTPVTEPEALAELID
jgi:uncharacterized protein YyaL (SSP411 family)